MLTALTILLVLVLLTGLGYQFYALVNGCPFAWLWFALGGVESTLKLVGGLIALLADVLSGE